MPEIIEGNLYDYPKYYDLIFGSDWKAEFQFLQQCFQKHADRPVKRLFEPACGTGRLLIKLAQAGYDVAGNDLNPHAINFCNDRLERFGFKRSTTVGDMSDFRLKHKVDAAFNMINSFRHLASEQAATSHLQCVSDALSKGGLYLLGLHLTPTVGPSIEEESWSARRGNLCVNSHMWTKSIDMKQRVEFLGMRFDIYTPTKHQQIVDNMLYRTWTAAQLKTLLKRAPSLELIETYDFVYDINQPIRISAETEDVVLVLRKSKSSGTSHMATKKPGHAM